MAPQEAPASAEEVRVQEIEDRAVAQYLASLATASTEELLRELEALACLSPDLEEERVRAAAAVSA
jgi:DNA polymerase III delta subunit